MCKATTQWWYWVYHINCCESDAKQLCVLPIFRVLVGAFTKFTWKMLETFVILNLNGSKNANKNVVAATVNGWAVLVYMCRFVTPVLVCAPHSIDAGVCFKNDHKTCKWHGNVRTNTMTVARQFDHFNRILILCFNWIASMCVWVFICRWDRHSIEISISHGFQYGSKCLFTSYAFLISQLGATKNEPCTLIVFVSLNFVASATLAKFRPSFVCVCVCVFSPLHRLK